MRTISEQISRGLAVVAATSTLVACGGGSGGGSATNPAAPPSSATASISAPADFGSTTVGSTSVVQTLTLTNSGTAALTVSSVSSDSAAFPITGGTCTAGASVAPAANCTVTVAFAPTAAGPATGALTFVNTTSPASPQAVTLTGTGVAVAPAGNSDLVTTVSAPTYAPGTTEKGGWDLLMAQRSACGFGLVQQDARLDVAAAAHTFYLVQNSLDRKVDVFGHYEDPTWTYFYGNSPTDRAKVAGFPDQVIESLDQLAAFSGATSPAPFTAGEALGSSSMRTLIETVYHARGAFWAGRNGGIASTLSSGPSEFAGTNDNQFRLATEISAETNTQKLGTGNVATFPCGGLTDVRGTYVPANEAPNPFPEVTDNTVIYGTPVYLKADAGSVLVVTSGSVTKVSDGTVLNLRTLTAANDPTAVTDPRAAITANEVFLVPTAALATGSSYAVHVVGTVNGTAFTKDFTFSTAP